MILPLRETVNGFQGPYRFLSNFYPASITIGDITYSSAEHAYQAYKTNDLDERLHIALLSSPGDAKRYWKNHINIRPDWEDVKLRIMALIVWTKFNQNPKLAQMLLRTGDLTLIEYNRWHDTYWGVCQCDTHRNLGKNMLGQILTSVRTIIRKR